MASRVVLSVALTLLTVAILGFYIGLEPQRQAAAAQRQRQEAVERGVPLYAGLCSGCHGSRGEGKVGPSLAGGAYLERHGLEGGDTSSLALAETQIRKTVARGMPRTSMPAWAVEEGGSLNQEQVLEIATFLLHGREGEWQRAASEAPGPAVPEPIPYTGVPDLAALGRQLYESKGCAACHGAKGEGGVGLALAGFDQAQIARQVRTPRGTMPAYSSDRLSDEEIKALAAFIGSLTKN